MSRIVLPTAWGSPDVLAVSEVDVPTARPGEVVVRVEAAGVNPIDWKLYSGSFHAVEDDHREHAGLAEGLPRIGLECAGVVVALGEGVDDVQVGDEVIVYPVTAAYADYVVASSSSILPKPSSLSWAEAAGLMLAGTTAAHALHAAGVRAGDTVLVHGGSGAVGMMAIQLARSAGAHVIATASERNHDLVRDLGATPVVYGSGLLERVRAVAPDGVDAAIDTVGTDEALDVSLELVSDPSRIASIAGSDRRIGAGVRILGNGPGQDMGSAFRAAIRPALIESAGSGDLRVVVADTIPLEDAARAHRLGIGGHQPGKVILVP